MFKNAPLWLNKDPFCWQIPTTVEIFIFAQFWGKDTVWVGASKPTLFCSISCDGVFFHKGSEAEYCSPLTDNSCFLISNIRRLELVTI